MSEALVRRSTICVLACVLVVSARGASAQSKVDGLIITIKSSVDSGNGGPPHESSSRWRIGKERVRMEVASGAVQNTNGAYVFLDPLLGRTTSVLPERRVAMLMASPGEMFAGMKIAFRMDLVGTPKYALEDLGAGEPMLGHATHHYRQTLDYAVEISIGQEKCRRTTRTSTEIWAAPDVAMGTVARAALDGRTMGFVVEGDAKQKIESLMGHRITGERLRSRQTTIGTGSDGTLRRISATMEITELTHEPLDASLFEIPAGYTMSDMRNPIPGLDDSLRVKLMSATMRRALCDPPKTP
jgi:hypothetical protein